MGLPAKEARAFPENLEEANLAGITPRIRVRTIKYSKEAHRTLSIAKLDVPALQPGIRGSV